MGSGVAVRGCYTMSEAAEALGRTRLTLKRWVRDGLIPPTVLADTVYQYRQYCEEELKLIAQQLAIHEAEFSYFTKKHVETIAEIQRVLQEYRDKEDV